MNIPADITMVRFTKLDSTNMWHCDMWDSKHQWYTGRGTTVDEALAMGLQRKVDRGVPRPSFATSKADIAGIELDL